MPSLAVRKPACIGNHPRYTFGCAGSNFWRQSFAIAGLIDNQVTQQMTKMPGIGNIPILGNLFKSRQLQKSDDELLIVVTPRVVHPLEPANVPAGPVFPKSFMPPAQAEKKSGSH